MIKKILLSISSLFLLWQSYDLLRNIEWVENQSIGLVIFIAWIINLFITGIFAFSGFAFPTQKLLPASYYKIMQPKRLKKIYVFLKVEWFRQMLLATLWKSKKQRSKHFNGKKEGISNLETQSQKSEFGHLIPLILISFLCIYLITKGLSLLAICTFTINIIGNLYPIILQRHHRMRIQGLRKRQEEKASIKESTY